MLPITADEIRGLDDKKIEKLEVPEWNRSVYIRTFTAGVRESMQVTAEELKKKNTVARFVFHSLCDEFGTLLFTNPADIEMLANKNSAAMARIFNAVIKLNAVGEVAMENAVKN